MLTEVNRKDNQQNNSVLTTQADTIINSYILTIVSKYNN